MVYVLSIEGKPLMPTKRHGKVRRLLKQGLAKVVRVKPFTIQLLYETTNYTQPVTLGIDKFRRFTMYTIMKSFTIDMAHRLVADYETPCLRLHGHTYTINLHLMRPDGDLDNNGMAIDFKKLKELFDAAIKNEFDHRTVLSSKDPCIEEMLLKFPDDITVIDGNPTAENFARIFYRKINEELEAKNTGVSCFKVDVFETAGNMASFSL